ncbi:hypothetical protein HHK36_030256 [Tetracentron sinense]|uniref:Clp ATPase C-terminal domain-containing protein n=1 Tax=Tetracentron sinense TaxID=13715 RepID=A0A835D049_TETSI|nr:hypothetical protein HHK36_030256 [Tetracentron sinense]
MSSEEVRLVALDMGALVAGVKFRGQIEERVKGVLDEVENFEWKVILFIDEVHLFLVAARWLYGCNQPIHVDACLSYQTNQVLEAACILAMDSGLTKITPYHVALTLISDPNGILRQAIANVGGGYPAANSFERALKEAMEKNSSEQPCHSEIPPSSSLKKVIRLAEEAQKFRGKTELAKALAQQLFHDENLLVRIDMSEYMDVHSGSRLFGAPPGYVGHEGGQLIEAVRRRLYSVVLLDEFEKANVGKHFWPELLNRLDEIVIFDSLSQEHLKKVVRIQMKDVACRLAERGIALAVSDAALDILLEESYNPVYGARTIRRWLEKKVVTELLKKLVTEKIDENSTVSIDADLGGKELILYGGEGWRTCEFNHRRHMPDKAIDLVDEAFANVKVQHNSQPEEIYNLNRKIIRLEFELYALEKEKDKASKACLVEVWKELVDVRDKLQSLMMKYKKEKERVKEIQRLKQRREEPMFSLQETERTMNWDGIADQKNGEIQAIEAAIAKFEGDTHENSLLTETRPDCGSGEPLDWDTSPRLGENEKERYVGHEEGGQFTEAVRRRPYSVVWLNEFEKANVFVFNTLLQVLGDGRLTDGKRCTTDFTNTVIIMTSNLGAQLLPSGLGGNCSMQVTREQVMLEVGKHFRPELLRAFVEALISPAKMDDLEKGRMMMGRCDLPEREDRRTATQPREGNSSYWIEIFTDQGARIGLRSSPIKEQGSEGAAAPELDRIRLR